MKKLFVSVLSLIFVSVLCGSVQAKESYTYLIPGKTVTTSKYQVDITGENIAYAKSKLLGASRETIEAELNRLERELLPLKNSQDSEARWNKLFEFYVFSIASLMVEQEKLDGAPADKPEVVAGRVANSIGVYNGYITLAEFWNGLADRAESYFRSRNELADPNAKLVVKKYYKQSSSCYDRAKRIVPSGKEYDKFLKICDEQIAEINSKIAKL